MFGGTDISTGLTFNVQYEAPKDFFVVNPISTLIRSVQKAQLDEASEPELTEDWSAVNQAAYADAKYAIYGLEEAPTSWSVIASYDPFEQATKSDATIEEQRAAVAYQQGAASVATFVEVLSEALAELDRLQVDGVNNTAIEQRSWSVEIYDILGQKVLADDTLHLATGFTDTEFVGGVVLEAIQAFDAAVTDVNDETYSEYITAASDILTLAGDMVSSAEPTGDWTSIKALTEITKVQQAAQGDAGERLVNFIKFMDDPATQAGEQSEAYSDPENEIVIEIPDTITTWDDYANAIGFDLEAIALAAQVGVIVPVTYEIANTGSLRLQEGANGESQDIEFVVTRGGNIESASSIEWEINTSPFVTGEKFGQDEMPSGILDFSPGEESKTITLTYFGDDDRGFDEPIGVTLFDTSGMSKIEVPTAFVLIEDDDPYTPLISVDGELSVGDARGSNLDLIADYYDPQEVLTVQIGTEGGSPELPDEVFEALSGQIGANGELSFEGTLKQINAAFKTITITGDQNVSSGLLSVSITSADGVRTGTEEVSLTVHNSASVTLPENFQAIAGQLVGLSGIEVSDVDSETVTVKLGSENGKIFMSDASLNAGVRQTASGIVIDGSVSDVNIALETISFKAAVGQETGALSVSVDDGDPLTSITREKLSIEIDKAPPEVASPEKAFVKTAVASKLGSISVADTDSARLTVTVEVQEGSLTLEGGVALGGALVNGLGTTSIELLGSSSDLNTILASLTYESAETPSESLSVVVTVNDQDAETVGASSEIDLEILGNAAPDPGSDIDVTGLQEDAGPQQITPVFEIFSDLEENLGGQAPNQIRILSIDSGVLYHDIAMESPVILGEDGEALTISGGELEGAIYFEPTADFSGDVSLLYVVVDPAISTLNSNPASITINVQNINDAPEIVGDLSDRSYVEEGAKIAVAPGLVLRDLDSKELSSVTVAVTDTSDVPGFLAGDILEFFGDTSKFDAALSNNDRELILTAQSDYTPSLADFQAAVRAVYFSSSDDPDASDRSITISVNDGSDANNITEIILGLAIEAINDAPTVGYSGGDLVYTEGDGAQVIFETVNIADADASDASSTNLSAATIKITSGYKIGQDILAGTSTDFVDAFFDAKTATLNLTAANGISATLQNFLDVIEGVTYQNSSEKPSTEVPRVIELNVTDAAENPLNSLEAATRTISVEAINDAPTLDLNPSDDTTLNAGVQFVGSLYPNGIAIAKKAIANDVDSREVHSITITITDPESSDVLEFDEAALSILDAEDFTISNYNSSTGELSVSGSTMSFARVQDILRGVLYKGEYTEEDNDRTVEILINDGTLSSASVVSEITLTEDPFASLASGATEIVLTGNYGAGGTVVADINSKSIIVNGSKVAVASTSGNSFGATGIDATGLAESSHNLFIFGDGEANILKGSSGDDVILGGGGQDIIHGGEGSDRIEFNSEASKIWAGTIDNADGLAEDNDVLLVSSDIIYGQITTDILGFEYISAERAPEAVNIDISSDDEDGLTAKGSAYADIISLKGTQTAYGGFGKDTFKLVGDGKSQITLKDVDVGEFIDFSGSEIDVSAYDPASAVDGSTPLYMDNWAVGWQLVEADPDGNPDVYQVIDTPTQLAQINSMNNDTGKFKDDFITNDGSAGRLIKGKIIDADGRPSNLSAGQNVEVSFDYNEGTGTGTWVTAKTNGSQWAVFDNSTHEESWAIVARVASPGGLASGPLSEIVDVTLDQQISKPSISIISDTGISTSDGITNEFSLSQPTEIETGAIVQYSLDGEQWREEPNADLQDGQYSIYVRQIDTAGNIAVSDRLNVTLDRIAPKITVDEAVAINIESLSEPLLITGRAPTNDAETEVSVSLKFITEEGVETEFPLENSSVTVQSDGTWSASFLLNGEGENGNLQSLAASGPGALHVAADMVDAAGNISNTAVKFIRYDVTAPEIEISDEIDQTVNSEEDDTYSITGTSTGLQGGRVEVAISDGTNTKTSIADVLGDSSWNAVFDISDLLNGELTVSANAADRAGNAAEEKTTSIQLDNVLPEITIDENLAGTESIISSQELENFEVSGTTNVQLGDASSTLSVTISDSEDTQLQQSSVDILDDGTWAVSFDDLSSLIDGDIAISAEVIDLSGNVGRASVAQEIVKDTVAPDVEIFGFFEIKPGADLDDPANIIAKGTTNGVSPVTVKLFVDGDLIDEAEVNILGGGWSKQFSGVQLTSDMIISIKADVFDAGGNAAVTAVKDVAIIEATDTADQILHGLDVLDADATTGIDQVILLGGGNDSLDLSLGLDLVLGGTGFDELVLPALSNVTLTELSAGKSNSETTFDSSDYNEAYILSEETEDGSGTGYFVGQNSDGSVDLISSADNGTRLVSVEALLWGDGGAQMSVHFEPVDDSNTLVMGTIWNDRVSIDLNLEDYGGDVNLTEEEFIETYVEYLAQGEDDVAGLLDGNTSPEKIVLTDSTGNRTYEFESVEEISLNILGSDNLQMDIILSDYS